MEDREAEQKRILVEGERLARLLGAGQPHYLPTSWSGIGGYEEKLLITYDEARNIIEWFKGESG